MNQDQIKPGSCVCKVCDRDLPYYLSRCISCGFGKQEFSKQMEMLLCQDNQFKRLGIVDFQFNQGHKCREILEFLVCYIEFSERDFNILDSKQFIIKPYLIPMLAPEAYGITQAQADEGWAFPEVVGKLSAESFIFENRDKAFAFLEQCKAHMMVSPIQNFIELQRVFPQSNGKLSIFQMMKQLKIPYSSEHFSLADVVQELLERGYKFTREMSCQLQNPIPEEINRIFGFRHLLAVCIQTTCERDEKYRKQREVIELAIKAYSLVDREIQQERHWFVKPTERPELSQYCMELTGISQEQINSGQSFETCIAEFKEFIRKFDIYCMITIGDMCMNQIKSECQKKRVHLEQEHQFYINLRKGNIFNQQAVFLQVVPENLENSQLHVREMLDYLGLQPEGRQYSAIDTARNMTRVLDELVKKNLTQFDERMCQYTFKL